MEKEELGIIEGGKAGDKPPELSPVTATIDDLCDFLGVKFGLDQKGERAVELNGRALFPNLLMQAVLKVVEKKQEENRIVVPELVGPR